MWITWNHCSCTASMGKLPQQIAAKSEMTISSTNRTSYQFSLKAISLLAALLQKTQRSPLQNKKKKKRFKNICIFQPGRAKRSGLWAIKTTGYGFDWWTCATNFSAALFRHPVPVSVPVPVAVAFLVFHEKFSGKFVSVDILLSGGVSVFGLNELGVV